MSRQNGLSTVVAPFSLQVLEMQHGQIKVTDSSLTLEPR